jgi:hypothetical protein
MQSEKASDHNDNNHYADDVKNIHCFAPNSTKYDLKISLTKCASDGSEMAPSLQESSNATIGSTPLERFPKRLNRDSHAGANMIQASYWEEASMDGEAVFGGLA